MLLLTCIQYSSVRSKITSRFKCFSRPNCLVHIYCCITFYDFLTFYSENYWKQIANYSSHESIYYPYEKASAWRYLKIDNWFENIFLATLEKEMDWEYIRYCDNMDLSFIMLSVMCPCLPKLVKGWEVGTLYHLWKNN